MAGDVINEIGGSAEDKADSITLSNAQTIDQLIFSRTEIKAEDWGNTLKIDVDYNTDGTVDDTLFVFDHYNENLGFRAVEKLFLDDGWDTDEIWNLVVGDNGAYNGSSGQDVLIAGYETSSTLYGGDGKDIMIGDKSGNSTIFKLGNRDGDWDTVADVIQGFGENDQMTYRSRNSDPSSLTADGDKLTTQVEGETVTIAEFKAYNDDLTLDQLLTEDGAIIYGAS